MFWPNNKFDTEAFTKYLLAYRLYPISAERLTFKQILKRTSNDLDRLYKMGLVLRKSVKRRAMTPLGPRNIGFKYEYSLSKQGQQYFMYLMLQTKAFRIDQEKSKQNENPVFMGDPLLEQIFKKILTSQVKIPPRAVDLFHEYWELIGRKGKRFNRFRSRKDVKLVVIAMLCAQAMPDKFERVLATADALLAVHAKHSSEEEDVHRSLIIEAIDSSKESADQMTKNIRAMAERARLYLQSGQYNQQLPVSPRHPYMILEVDEMLQRLVR